MDSLNVSRFEDALIEFVKKNYDNINIDHKTSILFIDFGKAFDMVDHKILLDKIEVVGIRGEGFWIGLTAF